MLPSLLRRRIRLCTQRSTQCLSTQTSCLEPKILQSLNQSYRLTKFGGVDDEMLGHALFKLRADYHSDYAEKIELFSRRICREFLDRDFTLTSQIAQYIIWGLVIMKDADLRARVYDEIASRMMKQKLDLLPVTITTILTSFVHTEQDNVELYAYLAEQTAKKADFFSVRTMSNSLWAVSKKELPETIMQTFVTVITQNEKLKYSTFSAIDFSNIFNALTRLEFSGREEFARLVISRSSPLNASAQSISNSLWSLAKLNIYDEDFINELTRISIKRIWEFNHQGLSNTIYAFAAFGIHHTEFISVWKPAVLSNLHTFLAIDFASILYSIQKLKITDDEFTDTLLETAKYKLPKFRPCELGICAYAAAMLPVPRRPFIWTVNEVVVRLLGDNYVFQPHTVCMLFYANAKGKVRDVGLFLAFRAPIARHILTFQEKQIAILLFSFSRCEFLDTDLVDLLTKQLLEHCLEDLTMKSLQMIFGAFARLRYYPGNFTAKVCDYLLETKCRILSIRTYMSVVTGMRKDREGDQEKVDQVMKFMMNLYMEEATERMKLFEKCLAQRNELTP